MLHGPLPAGAESLERRIAREEPGVVVDVLGIHASVVSHLVAWGARRWPPNPPSARSAPAQPGRASISRQHTGAPRWPPKPPSARSAPAQPGRSSNPHVRSAPAHAGGAPLNATRSGRPGFAGAPLDTP